MTKDKRRSSRIIMTNEARVLKELRMQRGLSMRKAGQLIGLSDSYIAHVETGRMDPPAGERLDRILGIYGGMKQKSFYERGRTFSLKTTPQDELWELINHLNLEKQTMLLAIGRSLAGQ